MLKPTFVDDQKTLKAIQNDHQLGGPWWTQPPRPQVVACTGENPLQNALTSQPVVARGHQNAFTSAI